MALRGIELPAVLLCQYKQTAFRLASQVSPFAARAVGENGGSSVGLQLVEPQIICCC